ADGFLALAAGDVRAAERASGEAVRRLPGAPLTRLLQAQTAQLRGDDAAAHDVFLAMTDDPATRVVGLRGLYIEADRRGDRETARHYAELARQTSGTTAWAGRALLRHQVSEGDWEGALRTLSTYADSRVLEKKATRRTRAVILTAMAQECEAGDPEKARQYALEAHDLAPDLVPAAAVAGRVLARLGEIRRAAKVLETTWKVAPHPEIAEAYAHVRTGDSALDRLKRVEYLQRMRPQADEGRLALARAAMEAREWQKARDAILPVIRTRPTQNALILMAEIEEAETGDRGRAREWLARAVHAPRDAAWIADGIVLEHWAPASPVTGRLDAVEWRVPVESLAGPEAFHIDEADLAPPPLPAPAEPEDVSDEAIPPAVAATETALIVEPEAADAAPAPPRPAEAAPAAS
ncbi:heme biosynthesis protein HemY, partial [Propylenella binzhouense]|uniref:heme biosynthesis protein HemY n=1 Tax=Propylenella binzhouense TaxID=2555902 RepID=UPI001369C6D6